MPFLHAHRRRVPAQDIDRSVMVGMGAETAMPTDEARLAFAALSVYGSAFRTGLRGMGRSDLAKVSAPLFEFVGKDGLEGEPTLIEDRAVQPGLLPDHASRRFERSSGACGHVPDPQVFKNDCREPPRDIERRLVHPISADTGAASRKFRHTPQRLCPPDGAALTTRDDALCGTLPSFNGFERARQRQALAVGQSQSVGDAPVNADRRAEVVRSDVFYLASEGYVPAQRVQGYGGVLDCPAQGLRVTESDPADFR